MVSLLSPPLMTSFPLPPWRIVGRPTLVSPRLRLLVPSTVMLSFWSWPNTSILFTVFAGYQAEFVPFSLTRIPLAVIRYTMIVSASLVAVVVRTPPASSVVDSIRRASSGSAADTGGAGGDVPARLRGRVTRSGPLVQRACSKVDDDMIQSSLSLSPRLLPGLAKVPGGGVFVHEASPSPLHPAPAAPGALHLGGVV